jgi:hypothetical protein
MKLKCSAGSVELVLGAGGVKGYYHIGVLRALVELGIKVSRVTGVSVGAIIAALFTNGLPPEIILKLFLEAHERVGNPLLLASSVVIPDLGSFLVGMSFLSLERPWKEAVDKLGLSPNPRLRIIACDADSKEAVVFEGEDYDLGVALSASGSLPGVFLPVRYGKKLLIDGAAYHRNPDEFCESTAIVSELGFAKTWPREFLDPLSAYFHWREIYMPVIEQNTAVDETRNVLIHHDADDVCGLSFSLSKKRCLEMYEAGYANAMRVIPQAMAAGRLPCDCLQAAEYQRPSATMRTLSLQEKVLAFSGSGSDEERARKLGELIAAAGIALPDRQSCGSVRLLALKLAYYGGAALERYIDEQEG